MATSLNPADNKYRDLPVISMFRQTSRIVEVEAIMREHDWGSFNRSASFVDEILTDDRISGVFDARMAALRGCPLRFVAAGERRREQRVADILGGQDRQSGIWRQIVPAPVQDTIISWGLLLGVGVAEICQRREAKKWTPYLRPWHPQWVRWDYTRRRFLVQTIRGEVVLPRPDEEANGDGDWLVYCPYGVEYGWRRGLLRSLALKYISRTWNERDWDRFNELHAMGIVKALLPGDAKDEDKEGFFTALANRGSETVVPCPQSINKDLPNAKYDVEIVEAVGRTWESFKERKAALDADIAVRVLGNNLSTEVQGGSFAAAKEHSKVALDKTLSDAEFGPVVRAQVLTWWAKDNFDDAELAPWPTYDVLPSEDEEGEARALGLIADAVTKLSLASGRVDVEAILETYEVPMFSEEEMAARAAEEEAAAAAAAANVVPGTGGMGGMGGMGAGGALGGGEQATFALGDRVQVKPGKEHMPEHKGVPGTIKIAQDGAYGILFDGIPGVHKWYAGDEIVGTAPSQKEPGRQALAMFASTKNQPGGVVARYQFAGLPIAIENPVGTIRLWNHPDGSQGSTRMQHDYGFIEGHLGSDGDELDCYIGPNEQAANVYVVHQLRVSDYRAHDEDKVMIGWDSEADARAAYVAHRNDGDRAIESISIIPVNRFRAKLRRRGPEATGKIRASHDLAGAQTALTRALEALVVRTRRPKALARNVAGGRRAAKYQDRLLERSTKLAARALAPDLAALKIEVDACDSLADLKKRILRLGRGLDPGRLQEVIRRANVLAHLSGRDSIQREI